MFQGPVLVYARCFDFDSKSIFYPWQQKIPDSNIFCNTSKLGA